MYLLGLVSTNEIKHVTFFLLSLDYFTYHEFPQLPANNIISFSFMLE
jgi:hypothetical protein